MKKVIVVGIAAALIINLAVFTVFGKRGLVHLQKLEAQLRKIEIDNQILTKENNTIRSDIELLKKNVQYIEVIARKELGMVKPDEIIYHIENAQN